MAAHVKNPRKVFLWQVTFVKHPINSYLFQSCTIPERTVEQVTHGDINRDVKTAGRISYGNLMLNKLETTSGSDTWLWDWMLSCQDEHLGGGLIPTQYWETIKIDELAEDGTSVINSWLLFECWPTRLGGQELDRMRSDNTMETIEISVGSVEKL